MQSYFFIPGTRLHKIKDILSLNVSQIIIDLEDAVKFSQRGQILNELKSNSQYKDFYIRIPLYEKGKLDNSVFSELHDNGFRKFIFPKIQNASDFDEIISKEKDSDLKIILLVETTRFLFDVKDILLRYETLFTGIGLGSHDFMSEVGGVHSLRNLEYIRFQVLYLARMIAIDAIDIASMELNVQSVLEKEIVDGLHKGYDAKFFIHPWQINIFKSISLYSKQEFEWARKVKKEYDKVGSIEEFNPIVIEGKIIERPHLAKAKKIINYFEMSQNKGVS